MQRKNLLIINGLVICILMFTTVGQGSEPKWHPLAEQEKLSILTEITESLQKLKSVGVSFEWRDGKLNKNGTEEITGEYNYFIVFDDHRQYLKQGLKHISEPDGAANSEESGFAPIVERNWNGTLMRSLDCRSSTGSIRGEVPYLTADEVMPFSIIGRDHSGQSWIKRYQNRDVTGIDYDVAIGAENENLVKVTGRPKNLTSIYARQTFIFDRTKDLAITRCYLENVYQDDDKIHRLSDIRFEDFKQINGVHIPYKISRIAKSPTSGRTGVQYITVKEVTINDKSHEKFLRDFTFPRNTNVYDYILDMPIQIGVESDELENVLKDGLQLAKKEIGQGVTNSIEHPYQGDTEKKLTENLIQSDFNENKNDPAIAKEQEDGVRIPYLISIVIILILAVVIGIVLKKRLNGHSAFIIICCYMLFGSNAFAEKTRNYQLYSPDLLDDLIPEHRAIYEKDMSRLCGINCLYQVYLWMDDQPKYRYRDLMKMVDYIDGVTIEEILDCAKQIGLEGHAKIVNYKYLLESAKSAKIALMTAPGKKAHFITYFGTEDKTSTYYIDYPHGQRHISEDFMLSRFKLFGSNPESIAIVEFSPAVVGKNSEGITFKPSRILIRDDKPWLLGKQPLEFESFLLNNSSKEVKILKVKESCRCTDFKLEKKIIKPGEKVRVGGKIAVKPGSPISIQILVLDDSNNSAILKIDVDTELPFEVSKRNLSFGVLAADDSKTLFYDVLVKCAYPLHLKKAYIYEKAKDSYVIDASIHSKMNVLLGDEAYPYTKYTIICNIETSDCGPLHTVHDLVLSFVDDEEYAFDHVVPIRFEVLETATP